MRDGRMSTLKAFDLKDEIVTMKIIERVRVKKIPKIASDYQKRKQDLMPSTSKQKCETHAAMRVDGIEFPPLATTRVSYVGLSSLISASHS